MNQGYIFWLFNQQLDLQQELAQRNWAQREPLAKRHRDGASWWRRIGQRRWPLGHAVTTQKQPVGCVV
jgi:hypothetical protein